MKIIVPTDFSETADNALNYSIELAKLTGAKLILLHAYHFPIVNDGLVFQNVTEPDFEEINRLSLQTLGNSVRAKEPDIDLELCLKSGLVVDVIINVAKIKNADLIVIGISEAGTFSETILGSNTIDTIKDSATPVLIIPSKAKFQKPTKILLALDYLESMSDQPLDMLMDFVNHFNVHVYVVHVMKENEKRSTKTDAFNSNVKKLLDSVSHSFHYPINENVVDGINQFVLGSDVEILAMIPHQHNIFYRLFNLSTTKKMAFHSPVPLLALPENTLNTSSDFQMEFLQLKMDLQEAI
jgi:nucleotide-binding universal stress UspA family protein